MTKTTLTDEAVKALLDGATPGPWRADGEPWNRIVWSSADNRVCFMSHSNGLNDERDVATSNLAAAAPDIARALLAARAERDRLAAKMTQMQIAWGEDAVKVEELTAELAASREREKGLREILVDAGALRDAADRVSEWFCTEARHLEGPRIQALRANMEAYDRHMRPRPTSTHAALAQAPDGEGG